MLCQNSANSNPDAGDGSVDNHAIQFNGLESIAFDSSMNLYIGISGTVECESFSNSNKLVLLQFQTFLHSLPIF